MPRGSDDRTVISISNLRTKLIHALQLCIVLGLCLVANCLGQILQPAARSLAQQPPAEYLLRAQLNHQVQLPCLVGRQLYCGEPYFIAWYKLNSSTKQWARIEHKSLDDLNEIINPESQSNTSSNERFKFALFRHQRYQQMTSHPSTNTNNNWQYTSNQTMVTACDQQMVSVAQQPAISRSQTSMRTSEAYSNNGANNAGFDCAQLTIKRVDLNDEGQYKCEITFSESLDFDKCPPTTMSRLDVIASPQEPEILINGKKQVSSQQTLDVFKEGAQVKLECSSIGGRPAPRIEWLNVSGWQPDLEAGTQSADPYEVQLMRNQWPQQKRVLPIDPQALTNTSSSMGPITSNSMTISLTRHDIRSRFVCLVLPAIANQGPGHGNQLILDQLIKIPSYLSPLLEAANLRQSLGPNYNQQQQQNLQVPMLRWIKLDIQVKPSGVGVVVRDLQTGNQLDQVTQSYDSNQDSARQQRGGPFQQFIEQPFYSLKPNKLYAIQCFVEASKPRSQITWFNRTTSIDVEQRELQQKDFLIPGNNEGHHEHRLSSFVRYSPNSNGTFRTSATLLITTNAWDNFEELFCRVSNEAFHLDELLQVAPIIPIRLYVNFAPFAWIELATESQQHYETPDETLKSGHGSRNASHVQAIGQQQLVSRPLGSELTLRCYVAANPLAQNTIVQIEWLKDSRKLAAAATSTNQQLAGSAVTGQERLHTSRLLIERENHLHMPWTGTSLSSDENSLASPMISQPDAVGSSGPSYSDSDVDGSSVSSSGHHHHHQHQEASINGNQGKSIAQWPSGALKAGGGASLTTNQLIVGAKLLVSSSLTIKSLVKTDAGSYGCRFKLIPAPGPQGQSRQGSPSTGSSKLAAHQLSSSPPVKITSGTADQTIQLNVIEAKLRSPIVRILSPVGLLLYGAMPPSGQHSTTSTKAAQAAANLLTLVMDQPADLGGQLQLSLGCDLRGSPQPSSQQHHKIIWYIDGVHLQSIPWAAQQPGQLHVVNVSLSRLFGDQAPGGASSPGRMLTCAHQFMSPAASHRLATNAFDASQLRLLHSANQIELRLRARPRLVPRRDLMPQIRSFSEQELAAQPSARLRLACLAQCEPLCSIDWLLDGRSLESRGSPTWRRLPGQLISRQGDQSNSSLLISANRQLLHRAANNNNQFQLFANWIHRLSQPYGWLSETILTQSGPIAQSEADLERLSGQLDRLAGDAFRLASEANVYSELDLSYQQVAGLLAEGNGRLLAGCRLRPVLESNGLFGHSVVEPNQWHPQPTDEFALNNSDQLDNEDGLQQTRRSLDTSSLNLRSASLLSRDAVHEDIANLEMDSRDLSGDLTKSSEEFMEQAFRYQTAGQTVDATPVKPLDGLQTSILIDQPPRELSISFGDITSSMKDVNGVILSEAQLIDELMNPDKPVPVLHCKARLYSYPIPKFQWSFTDINGTEFPSIGEGPKFNLRQFIELKQKLLNASSQANVVDLDLVANIVGNYTCIATNIHGSAGATLPLQVQGRPLCKLSLAGEYLGRENELIARVRCSVYSWPPLVETVWYRGGQQLSDAAQANSSLSVSVDQRNIMTAIDLPIIILNKQQDFLPMDLISSSSNLKCIARNSLGHSDACELSQSDRQSLLNVAKPIGGKSSSLSVMSLFHNPDPVNRVTLMGNASGSAITGLDLLNPFLVQQMDSINVNSTQIGLSSWAKNLSAQLGWLLILICACSLTYLVYLLGCTLVRRRYLDSSAKIVAGNHNTSWRFNTPRQKHPTDVSSGPLGLPFASKTICVNYYGGSNEDSEHDMIQSCSNSSHYDEYAQHQQQMHQRHLEQQSHQLLQQPLYFNGCHPVGTLQRRAMMKPSFSSSSNSGAELGSSSSRSMTGTRDGPVTHMVQPKLATTMRECLANNTCRYSTAGAPISMTSNTPLINGTLNSRINLDQQPKYRFTNQKDQQSLATTHHQTQMNHPRNEHIYDDVIYNQMIL